MKLLLCFLIVLLLGCGGSGGSGNSSSGDESPQTTSLLCEHDGDLWLCPATEGGSCVRDQSSVEEGSVLDSEARLIGVEQNGRVRPGLKLTSGPITIIAECGSNVSFNVTEETSSDTTITTATANFNVGSTEIPQ